MVYRNLKYLYLPVAGSESDSLELRVDAVFSARSAKSLCIGLRVADLVHGLPLH